MGVHVVALVVAIAILWGGPAVLTGRVARRQGHPRPIVYVIAALVVGWPMALVAATVRAGRGRGGAAARESQTGSSVSLRGT